jgi:hypothetical protein
MLKKQGLLILAALGILAWGTGAAYAADDQPPAGQRAVGRISAIDLGADTFTLETLRQSELAVHVTRGTEFRSRAGDVQGIEDLETGMPVVVSGQLDANGELLADVVGVGKPGERPVRFQVRGEITSVEPSGATFSLKNPLGIELEIHVSESTRFLSRDDSITGIDDLQVGMLAQVRVLRGTNGQLNALRAAVGSPEDRPDIRALGEITDIGDNVFTLNTRQGRTLTLAVDGTTRYHSRDGSVTSFEDLQVGMKIAVAADQLSDGTYKAIAVGVGGPEAEPLQLPQIPHPAGPGV